MTRELKVEQIERVVVRGANWVGDAVMTVPALCELRRLLPHARITLATRSWAEGIFADVDFVDDLLLIDERARGLRSFMRQVGAWRAHRFDLALLLPNAFEPALVAAAARVPMRFGYATDARARLLTHALPPPDWRSTRHEVFYYLYLVAALEHALTGAQTVTTRAPAFALSVSDVRRHDAGALLHAHGIKFDRPLVALCPGSTNSRAKRWPVASYAALADRLIEESGAAVVLIGARAELDVTEQVVAQMQHQPIVLTGETNLAQTVAVLSLVDLLVTNDTGPAHIAAALQRPTLVIFGPTNSLTTRPFAPVAEIIREPPDCAPCMLRDCPIDHRCMTAITPMDVFSRAQALLACVTCPSHAEVAR
ncbi:MAG: lipopolysaccharide heptosyltransferase II [Acidobacteria bacterium]|nr:MAG: lipopolysaccharide heptosyltransferase II [Acidobacteriota bacterium]